MSFDTLRIATRSADFLSIANRAVIYAGAPITALLEAYIVDALGVKKARTRLTHRSRDSVRDLMRRVAVAGHISGKAELLRLSRALFARTGEGRFTLADRDGKRIAVGSELHEDIVWKSGRAVPGAYTPLHAFASGWIAAGLEQALDRPVNSVVARPRDATYPPREFDIGASPEREPLRMPVADDLDDLFDEVGPGGDPTAVAEVTELRTALYGFDPGTEGHIYIDDAMISLRPVTYSIGCLYETYHALLDNSDARAAAFAEGVREVGRRTVLDVFAPILGSRIWREIAGELPRTPAAAANSLGRIARALGFGRWNVEEEAGVPTALVAVSSIDGAYYRLVHEPTPDPRAFLSEGIADGIRALSVGIDWASIERMHPARVAWVDRHVTWGNIAVASCITMGKAPNRYVIIGSGLGSARG